MLLEMHRKPMNTCNLIHVKENLKHTRTPTVTYNFRKCLNMLKQCYIVCSQPKNHKNQNRFLRLHSMVDLYKRNLMTKL